MEKPIPYKEIYKEGFIYSQSQNDLPGQDGRLPIDTIGNTGMLPNRPTGLAPTETVIFDTTVKRTPEMAGSARCTAKIENRWFNANESYKTFRYMHTITSPQLKANEIWFGFSIMFPENYELDGRTNIIFNFGGVGGGAFSFRENNGNFQLTVSRLDENTTSNRIVFTLGPSTGGVWHDFIIKAKWSPLTEVGELTIWKDRKLARLYHPVTREPWEVVTSQTSGVQAQYTLYPSKGSLVNKVTEGGKTVDTFVYKGFTLGKGIGGDQIDHNFRTGWYYAGWNTNIDPVTGAVLPGTYIEGNPLYIKPSLRTRIMWTGNVKWQPVDSPMGPLSDDTIFMSLDHLGRKPLEIPYWYVPDEEIDPVSIVSPANDSNFQLGQDIEIETDAEDGEVDLLINGKAFETKIQTPYNFIIEAGTIDINDSILNLKFEDSLFDDSPENNSITLENPGNATYVEGSRGQGLSMGMGEEVIANRAYISINPGPRLANINGPFTISYSVKGEIGFAQQLFGNGSSSLGGLYAYALSNGRTDFFIASETGTVSLTSSPVVSTTRLSPDYFGHFAWVYDGDWLRCYYNGVQTASVQIGEVDFPTTFPQFLINSRPGSGRGQLVWDDFRIYDYAIPEEEIHKTVEDNYIGQLELKVRRLGVESDPVTINIVEELPTFTITATATTGGNVSGAGDYEENEEVTLTATPDSGYEFVGWEEDSSIVSTSNPYIFNAEEDRSLLAVFQQIEYQLTVTYTAGGTATGSGEYTEGEQVELTATPNSGYIFTGWYRDSDLISGANPYNYTTRGQADTVQARFELIPIPEFTITVIPSTGGTVSGGGTYEEGQSVTLSAMPQSGWTFVKWSNEATANPYSFNASENLTISAIFEEVNPEVPYIIVKGKFKIV